MNREDARKLTSGLFNGYVNVDRVSELLFSACQREAAAGEAAVKEMREKCARLCRELRLGFVVHDAALKQAEDDIRKLPVESANLDELLRQAREDEANWWFEQVEKLSVAGRGFDIPDELYERLAQLSIPIAGGDKVPDAVEKADAELAKERVFERESAIATEKFGEEVKEAQKEIDDAKL